MAYTKRSLEELNIMDDFLLNAVTTDEEVGEPFCREILSVLLQREIGTIRIVPRPLKQCLTISGIVHKTMPLMNRQEKSMITHKR